jgi:hypothetical protein
MGTRKFSLSYRQSRSRIYVRQQSQRTTAALSSGIGRLGLLSLWVLGTGTPRVPVPELQRRPRGSPGTIAGHRTGQVGQCSPEVVPSTMENAADDLAHIGLF